MSRKRQVGQEVGDTFSGEVPVRCIFLFFYFSFRNNMASIQCRTVEIDSSRYSSPVDGPFVNYGNVVGLHAVREHAIEAAASRSLSYAVVSVEMRDTELGHDRRLFRVSVEPKAEVLNPRLDTDKVPEKRSLLSRFWNLF